MTDHNETNHAAGGSDCQPNGVREVVRISLPSDFNKAVRHIDKGAIAQMDLHDRVSVVNFLLSAVTDICEASPGRGLDFMEIQNDGRGWKLQPTTETVDRLINYYRQKAVA